jgi:hypothetical protein
MDDSIMKISAAGAIAAMTSVTMATSALADHNKTFTVYNNTSYDFTYGGVNNREHITLVSHPGTIKAGDSGDITIDVKSSSDNRHIEIYYTTDNGNVSMKYELQTEPTKDICHTASPSNVDGSYSHCGDSGSWTYTFKDN